MPENLSPDPADYRTPAVGDVCTFYSEVQQEYESPEDRLRRFTGQEVTVIAELGKPDVDSSEQFTVRASDGTEFTAWSEELSGWDLALGQFFWPDGTFGPEHRRDFLVNEEGTRQMTSTDYDIAYTIGRDAGAQVMLDRAPDTEWDLDERVFPDAFSDALDALPQYEADEISDAVHAGILSAWEACS
jgi:hypothetical protein